MSSSNRNSGLRYDSAENASPDSELNKSELKNLGIKTTISITHHLNKDESPKVREQSDQESPGDLPIKSPKILP